MAEAYDRDTVVARVAALVDKARADSFEETDLESVLAGTATTADVSFS